MGEIFRELAAIQARIARAAADYGRDPDGITVLAVSKGHTAQAIEEAVQAGQFRFGENRLQEALPKIVALDGRGLEWHFIGPVQANKTRQVAENFAWVHSVDRLKIAQRLGAQRPPGCGLLNVCIQVNVSGEAGKSGIAIHELAPLAHAVMAVPGLCLRGLMAIPAHTTDTTAQRAAFRKLAQASEALRAAGLELDTLSMGMTGDLESAVAEGATLIRIGTGVFGLRNL